MVRESVKRLSAEEQELCMDLDLTEWLFYQTKSKKTKQAINNLRYLIIVRLHQIREGDI